MKIGIISDTHDNTPAVSWIIDYLNGHGITTALHAGDLISPGIITRFEDYYDGHLHFVFGNNDGEIMMITHIAANSDKLTCHNREMSLEIEGKRIFMNHYSTFAQAQAKAGGYDVCVGGHDHQYRITPFEPTLFINSGNTVTHDKWMGESDRDTPNSFVVLDLESLETQQVIVEPQT